MADDILKGTMMGTTPLPATPKALQVPNATGDSRADIKNLGNAQQQPSALLNLQKAMQLSSRTAYNERQTQELGAVGQQFDPTKVSGGTFANIIGNLEQKRGADVSKIYASTMNTYQAVQQEITQRLETLKAAEESKRRFEEEMKQRKEELKRLKENDKKAYEMEKKKFDMDKKSWELSYSEALKKANATGGSGYSSDYVQNLVKGFSQITVGEDGHIDPNEYGRWASDALKNIGTLKDASAFNTYNSQVKNLLNPADVPSNNSGWGG